MGVCLLSETRGADVDVVVVPDEAVSCADDDEAIFLGGNRTLIPPLQSRFLRLISGKMPSGASVRDCQFEHCETGREIRSVTQDTRRRSSCIGRSASSREKEHRKRPPVERESKEKKMMKKEWPVWNAARERGSQTKAAGAEENISGR